VGFKDRYVIELSKILEKALRKTRLQGKSL
jgi:hypothetical protein